MSSDLFEGVSITVIGGVIVGLVSLAIYNIQKLKDLPWEIYLEIKYRKMKLVDELLVCEMRRIDEQISKLKQEQHSLHPSVVEPELRRLGIMKRMAHRIYYKRFTKDSEKIDKAFKRWASQTPGSKRHLGMIREKIAEFITSVRKRIRLKRSRAPEAEVIIDGISELWAVPRRTRKENPCTEKAYRSPIYLQIKGGYIVRRKKPIEPHLTQHPGPEFAIKKDGKDIVVCDRRRDGNSRRPAKPDLTCQGSGMTK